MRIALFIMLAVFIATEKAAGQEELSFARAIDVIGTQWMSVELEENYHHYFHSEDCPPHFQISSIPKNSDRWTFSITSDNNSQKTWINRLLKEDCMRFIHLKALSDYYFPKFEDALRKADLPRQYMYLPVALSALNREYESTTGRLGIWQLSYLEARRFGLTIHEYIDERNDPDKELAAAIQKLTFLHKQYKKPELVIVSWIKGVPYTNQIIAQTKKGDPFLWDKESTEFLSYFSVCVSVLNAFALPDFSEALGEIISQQTLIDSPVSASFRAYSALLGIEEKELSGRNPWLIADYIPKKYAGALNLPNNAVTNYRLLRDSIGRWDANQDSIQREKKKIEAAQETKSITYKVKRGDVLGNIAERFNVGLAELKKWNNLKRDLIYVGQELLIYTSGNNSHSSSSDTSAKPEKTIKYTVRAGDTLWSIARKFPGVSPDDIMDINEIDDNIVPGQALVIPQRK